MDDGVKGMRILVMSPHPDDDVISMGGTLANLCQQGYEVASVQCISPPYMSDLLLYSSSCALECLRGTIDISSASLSVRATQN